MWKRVVNASCSQTCPSLFVVLTEYSSRVLGSRIHCKRNFFLLSNNCLYNYNARHFVDNISKIEKQEKFIHFWENYRLRLMHKKYCVDKLVELLKCERDEAKELIREHPQLFVEDMNVTENKINLLITSDVPSDVIRNNLWVLRFASSRLKLYLRGMKQWGIDRIYFPEFLPLLNLAPSEFFKLSDRFLKDKEELPFGNRVVYLATLLNCNVSEILPRMLNNKTLMQRKCYKIIEENVKLFREFGVELADVVRYLSALCSYPATIRRNLTALKELGVDPIKPWMMCSKHPNFKQAIQRNLVEKETSLYNSYIEFLAAKFEIDKEEIIMRLTDGANFKYVSLFNLRPSLFMEKMEFLTNHGYVRRELLDTPYVFNCSVNTLSTRMKALQKLGIEKPSLKMLSKNCREFQEILDSMIGRQGMKTVTDSRC